MHQQNKNTEDSFTIVDILIIVAIYKRRLVLFPVAVAGIAILVSLVIPSAFKASTLLLPPQQSASGTAALLSQLNGVAGAVAGNMNIKSSNDLYIGMLKSKNISDQIIKKFDLKTKYDTSSLERARTILAENTTVVSGKDGLITIEVEDRDQRLVAPLANAYVSELFRLNSALAITEASQRRVFYERQLEDAKSRLATAEVNLKNTLGTRGVVSVDSDSRAILEIAGRLKAQISSKEIQLQSLQAFVTENNNEYRRVEQELRSLRAELTKFENGSRNISPSDLTESNSNGLESIKLLRDLKYRQMLYELLAKQYEVARLDEAKDPSLIQVLDAAQEPERRFKPKRAFIVIGSTLAALIFAIFSVFISETKRVYVSSVSGKAKWTELKSHLLFKKR